MIKASILAVSFSIFIVSTFISLSGFSGILKENLITGSIIGPTSLATIASLVSIISFLITVFLAYSYIKKINN